VTAPVHAALLRERRVAPSILFGRLRELRGSPGPPRVLAVGARVIHVDVMDGHFVPPITFGASSSSALADLVHDAGGILDVHMMWSGPERPRLRHRQPAGRGPSIQPSTSRATPATVHYKIHLDLIRTAGATAGAALTPATPRSTASTRSPARTPRPWRCCMSGQPPGWGRPEASFPNSLSKLRAHGAGELPAEVGPGGVRRRDPRADRRSGHPGRGPTLAGDRLGRVRGPAIRAAAYEEIRLRRRARL